MRALCVSIHDVAPRTLDACTRIADALEALDARIPLTLLVVPCYHGDRTLPADYLQWIGGRLARGDEVALHGLTHVDETSAPGGFRSRLARRVYTAGEGEFAALERDEAARRIERGRAWFAERGWTAEGFVAPAWLVSRGTWDVLRESPFRYTTTLGRFHVLESGRSVRAPTLVYSTRSGWRRGASRAWNAALAAASASAALVRVGLHPADAAHPAIMSQALDLIERLAREREPLTKAAFARALH
jgi:predicted deacetylase